ncbi:MAG: cell division protein FtsZ [Bacteroidales bacterium]|nr:cell division protein FtsZ [Bacteroidales bacterium]
MEMNENTSSILEFDAPKEQPSYIKVIGVGGGGVNAVSHMYNKKIEGVEFIACNTDMKSLHRSPIPNKIELSKLGAGGNPEVASKFAWEKADIIREKLSHNTQMLFITAGMGGGTGTGAAPVIAEIAKEIDLSVDNEYYDSDIPKMLVVAVVTTPFDFEGKKKREIAEQYIQELRKHADCVLIISNEKVLDQGNFFMQDLFAQANDVLYTAVEGIAGLMTSDSLVNADFHDVNTVMANSGTALMGIGIGKGENRAYDAIEAATTSALLDDNDIAGAKKALYYITCSSEHPLDRNEFLQISHCLTSKIGTDEANIKWGMGTDDSLGEELKITLIATGFEHTNHDDVKKDETKVWPLQNETKEEPAPAAEPVNDTEMKVINKEPEAVAEQPVSVVEPEPVHAPKPAVEANANQGQVHVLVLDDEVKEAEEKSLNEPAMSQANQAINEIKLVSEAAQAAVETAPVAQAPVFQAPVFDFPAATEPVAVAEKPVVAQAPVQTAEEMMTRAFTPQGPSTERSVTQRADRIKSLIERLRSNPDSITDIENTLPNGGAMAMAMPSSHSEVSRSAMGQNGKMSRLNGFLFDNPD